LPLIFRCVLDETRCSHQYYGQDGGSKRGLGGQLGTWRTEFRRLSHWDTQQTGDPIHRTLVESRRLGREFNHHLLRKGPTMAKKQAATPAKKAMTKSEILNALSESSELSKKEIAGVFDDLSALIAKNLKKNGPGVFTIPGLSKIKVVRKPATKARKGINPFTKEETVFKAKPARNVVKILPLKALKDMV
jgi:nucleoid DNA-binding protein